MGTNPSTPTVQTNPTAVGPTVQIHPIPAGSSRPTISADEAVRTLQRLRAEAQAGATDLPVGPVSLDADTFRRFVSTVRRHARPVARPAARPVVSMPRVDDALMAHRMKTFS